MSTELVAIQYLKPNVYACFSVFMRFYVNDNVSKHESI